MLTSKSVHEWGKICSECWHWNLYMNEAKYALQQYDLCWNITHGLVYNRTESTNAYGAMAGSSTQEKQWRTTSPTCMETCCSSANAVWTGLAVDPQKTAIDAQDGYSSNSPCLKKPENLNHLWIDSLPWLKTCASSLIFHCSYYTILCKTMCILGHRDFLVLFPCNF